MNKATLTTLCFLLSSLAACDQGSTEPSDPEVSAMLERVVPELDAYDAALADGVEPAGGAPSFVVEPETAAAGDIRCTMEEYLDYCFGYSGQYSYEGQCLGVNVLIDDWCIIMDPSLICMGDAMRCSGFQ